MVTAMTAGMTEKTSAKEGAITSSGTLDTAIDRDTETLPPRRPDFDQLPVYSGDDLGVAYTPQATTFKLWAPTAKSVTLQFFRAGEQASHDQLEMK